MPSWNWDEEASGSGVVHQNTANTDHTDAAILKQGYDYANFSQITPTPEAAYPLHEDSGSTANDLAGINDGTYTGATLGQTGLLGTTAADFDGTDDYVTTYQPGFGTGAFSISFWVNPDALGTTSPQDDRTFISNFDGSGGIIIQHDASDNETRFWISGNPDLRGPVLSTGTWQHIVCTASTSTAKIYIDGVEEASASRSGDASATEPINIARRPDGRYADGRMADVRYYNTELSASEVIELYNVVNTTGEWVGNGKIL